MAMCTSGWSVRMGSRVPWTACAARGASSGSNVQPSSTRPVTELSRTRATLVTPMRASVSSAAGSSLGASSEAGKSIMTIATCRSSRLRFSGEDARPCRPSRSSVNSLDFELRHPRREFGSVARAHLPQHVRDVPLDRLARQEELLRDLWVARSTCDQERDLVLAFGEPLSRRASVPCSHPERAQLPLGQLNDRQRAPIGGGRRQRLQLCDGPLVAECRERPAEVEPDPQCRQPEFEALRRRQRRLEADGAGRGLLLRERRCMQMERFVQQVVRSYFLPANESVVRVELTTDAGKSLG